MTAGFDRLHLVQNSSIIFVLSSSRIALLLGNAHPSSHLVCSQPTFHDGLFFSLARVYLHCITYTSCFSSPAFVGGGVLRNQNCKVEGD